MNKNSLQAKGWEEDSDPSRNPVVTLPHAGPVNDIQLDPTSAQLSYMDSR